MILAENILVTIEDYRRALEEEFSDPADAGAEWRMCQKEGPLIRIVAGMKCAKGLLMKRDHDDKERVKRSGNSIDYVQVNLSGFKWRDLMPGQKAPEKSMRWHVAVAKSRMADLIVSGSIRKGAKIEEIDPDDDSDVEYG